MSEGDNNLKTTTVKDVKQLGTFAALASLSYVFWICGGMEMVERLAYYGVRSLASLYGTNPKSSGALGLTGTEIGFILSTWLLIQGLVPVFTGGIADRFGYKETIFVSTATKIIGYLVMAWFPSFMGFLAGAWILAFGTGIFKPGIQGTIVKATGRHNSSVAWGVFYQTVNIGGFLGPVLAGQLRQLEWSYVFYACAAIISLNFLLLLTYKEPDKEERLAHKAKVKSGEIHQDSLLVDSIKELSNPILLWYMLLFSGFWFMLYIYWDLGPLYFRDWVDTSVLVKDVWGTEGPGAFSRWFFVLSQDGTRVMPEGMVNINSLLIMLICFLVTGWSARMKAANAMAVGTFLASAALLLLGGFNAAWVMVFGIVIFSLGEMLSSPKCLEFLGNVAPPQKKAMYLGFSQLPFAVGAFIEGMVGQITYEKYASKDTLSREMLLQNGMSPEEVKSIPIGDAFQVLVDMTGQAEWALTNQMYTANDIGSVFYIFAAVGIVSAFGLFLYGRWTYRFAMSQQADAQAAK
ncbi:MFS transporter [Kordiimonas lipolytica]|uniref:MFS transporter n=1 Tax=Kordiimonas lipolytica TaxID=1662421 RepID=A0ABV8U6G0_9PROT|nr:MFS transporter [Kordiimonas lipolytica]